MDDEENSSNNIPECGAIFMSSSITKKECFDRHVFALPSSKANFVKHVKTGMMLFLFEYENRKLYGVFQATCDGDMDIVPNGFRYSGRRFPAQVRVKPIWFCHPLSEKEFKGAIRENYFTQNKFKFGLSEYQVRRLLSLFNSKKVNMNPTYRVPEHVKDLEYVGSDGLRRRDRAFNEDDDNNRLSSDHQGDPFLRAKEYELMKRGAVHDDREVYSEARDFRTDNHNGFLTKKRRLDYQDRLLTRDVAENENFADRRMSRSSCIGSPIKVRGSMDSQRLVTSDRNYNENQLDELLNPVNKYPTELLEARRADYDHYMQRNCLFGDPNLGDGSNDQYSNLLNNYAVEGNMLRSDDRLLRDYNSSHREHLVCSDRDFNLVPQVMNRTDNHQRLLNEESESRYPVCDDGIPVTESVPFTSRLHRERRSSAGGMFYDNDEIEGEHEFVTPILGSSAENYPRPLEIERRIFYDRKIRLAEKRVTDRMTEIGLSSTNCRSSGGSVENVDVHTCIGRTMSKYSSPFSKPQQVFSSFENSIPETRIIPTGLSVSQNHHNPSSTFDDPTTTIVAAQRSPGSETTDLDSNFRQDYHPYSLSNSYASQFFSESCSKSMGQQLEGANPLSKSFNPNLSRQRVPNAYTPADENLFTSNGQLQTASQDVSDHNNHMETKEDTICLETKNTSQVAAYSPTAIDLSSKEHQKVSDEQCNPTTRRSVFSRLKRPLVDEGRNDGGFNHIDHCMEASADEVMEMLLPRNNLPLSLRMLNDSNIVAQPEKHPHCQVDLTTPTAEEKNLNDYSLSNEESVDEVPKESRIVDFKRRGNRKRSLVGTPYKSATEINVTVSKGEAGNSTRRRKLVRPLFGKTESASKVIGNDTTDSRGSELTHVNDDKQNCQVQNLSNEKSEVQTDVAGLSSHESPHDKKINYSEKQKCLGVENCDLQVSRVGDDTQKCQRSISNVQNDDASLSGQASSHENKNNHSEEKKDQGVENCSLQVTCVGDDKQNRKKSISNVQIDDASVSSRESPCDKKNDYSKEQKEHVVEHCGLQVTRVGDKKQNFQKSISNDKGEVQIDDTSLSSNESLRGKNNDHSEEQKYLWVDKVQIIDAGLSSHESYHDKKYDRSEEKKNLGVEISSLQMTCVGDDEQNCQKSISNVQNYDASLSSNEFPHGKKKNDHSEEQKDLGVENCSFRVTRVGDNRDMKRVCQKSISGDKGKVQSVDASLCSHESFHDKKNDRSKEQQNLGVANCRLQANHEKTTEEQNLRLKNSTIFLPKEVDSTVESLKHGEPSSEKSKSDVSSRNAREGKKTRLVKRIVKKIVKIRKVRLGKGQNFEKDNKPSGKNSQGNSEVVSLMNNQVP